MRMGQTLTKGACAVFALFANGAIADVTADDVWANLRAYAGAFGGDLTATTNRAGDTMTVNDIVIRFAFPMQSGRATLGISGIALIENGDGTVSILYAADPTLTFGAIITGEGDGSAAVRLVPGTYSIVASGQPGDVTYDSAYENLSLTLDEITSSDSPDLSALNTTASLSFDGWTARTRVSQGDLVTVSGEIDVNPYSYDIRAQSAEMSVHQDGGSGHTTSNYSFAVPAGGTDPLQLGAAFDKGMFFDITSTSEGTQSRSRIVMDDQVVSDQSTAQGSGTGRLRVDGQAIVLTGSIAQTEMSMVQDELPMAIAFDVAQLAIDMLIPVSASPDPQAFHYMIDTQGIRVGADIWALFDPEKALPRDPADFKIDLSGEAILDIDVLDGQSIMAAMESPDIPVHLTRLALTAANLAALGVTSESSGAFTFDNGDLTTFDGLPRPEGRAVQTVTGLNALFDLLISTGILTRDDVTGMRMGMTMFTDSVGDDQIRSELVIDPLGGVTVNGQRIK